MKILFVCRDYRNNKNGGSAVVKRNLSILKALGYDVEEFIIPTPSLFIRFKNLVFRESYGSTRELSSKLKSYYLKQDYSFVFFDGSNYGKYLKLFARSNFTTICFYHNVESVYYEEKYKVTKKLTDKLMISFITYNERLSTINSSYAISLNERDSNELCNRYRRKADFILPTSFSIKKSKQSNGILKGERYVLFVGSNFFANIEAMNFYLNEVAPSLTIKTKIVGSIVDSFKDYNVQDNVEFVGVVDDLQPYYDEAQAIIAPIFSGSGLKTKTIEALAYSKTIIGSSESFEGVPLNEYPEIGFLCNSAEEYIDVINNKQLIKHNSCSQLVFNLFFSDVTQINRFKMFLREKGLY